MIVKRILQINLLSPEQSQFSEGHTDRPRTICQNDPGDLINWIPGSVRAAGDWGETTTNQQVSAGEKCRELIICLIFEIMTL